MRISMTMMMMAAALAGAGCKPKAATLPMTNPLAWSKAGWQDLRWGMGPGDVEAALQKASGDLSGLRLDALPAKKVSEDNPDHATISLGAERKLGIAGSGCVVVLDFYKDQLYAVVLEQVGGTPTIDADRRWVDDVHGVLTEKYGKPTGSEVQRCQTETRGRGPVSVTCSDLEPDEKYTFKQVTWETEALTVRLGAVPYWPEKPPGSGKYPELRLLMQVHYLDPIRSKWAHGVNPSDRVKL